MKHLLIAASLLLGATSAFAQTDNAAAPTGNGQPIEITATETVEWLRGQNQYVARKDVIVTQGAMQIFSDLLTADYREGAQSSMEIWQLTAEGNVRIKDETNTAYGDKGVYDVIGGVATLTGQNLKLVSPDQTVTATDKMEYFANTKQAKATGNATVTRATDTLKANVITAFFKDSAAAPETEAAVTPEPKKPDSPLGGSGNLDRLEADGNVVIKTPTETLYGNKAIYRADTNTAELVGKVRVERGENVLEGDRAEVNLTTNVSKMFASKKSGSRVRGVFFPGANKTEGGADKKGPDKTVKAKPAPAASPKSEVPAAPTAPEKPEKEAKTPEAAPTIPPSNTATIPPAAPVKVSPRVAY